MAVTIIHRAPSLSIDAAIFRLCIPTIPGLSALNRSGRAMVGNTIRLLVMPMVMPMDRSTGALTADRVAGIIKPLCLKAGRLRSKINGKKDTLSLDVKLSLRYSE